MEGIDFRQRRLPVPARPRGGRRVVPRRRSRCSTGSACPRGSCRWRRRSRSSPSSSRTACWRRPSASSTATRRRSRSSSGTRAGSTSGRAARWPAIDVEAGRVAGVETSKGPIGCGTRRLLRGRLVARGRGAGRRRPARRGREALDLVLARGRRPARAAAADDRLLHVVLLPPRGAGPRLRRERADARGGGGARRAPAAAAGGSAGADVVVGLLRDQPRLQRAGRAGGRARSGFLYATGFSGHGFQQAPAVGRARGGADRRARADARPLGVRRRPLRARERQARGVRRLTAVTA